MDTTTRREGFVVHNNSVADRRSTRPDQVHRLGTGAYYGIQNNAQELFANVVLSASGNFLSQLADDPFAPNFLR